jgi:hypothetical protein
VGGGEGGKGGGGERERENLLDLQFGGKAIEQHPANFVTLMWLF